MAGRRSDNLERYMRASSGYQKRDNHTPQCLQKGFGVAEKKSGRGLNGKTMKCMRIRLTESEMHHAEIIGKKRQSENISKGRKDANNFDGDGLGMHILGARGEMAVAKALGLPWDVKLGDLGAAEVGPLQVRTGTWPGPHLLLHHNDRGNFILVQADGRSFNLLGWIPTHEGKSQEYWQDRKAMRPCYWIPASNLRAMNELIMDKLS